MEKAPKKNNLKSKLVIAIMITAALFIAELYVMINQSNNMVLVIGIAVLILIALYFVIAAILDCVNADNSASREQYENIYKSSKASYMLLKRNLDELSKQVNSINAAKSEDVSLEIIKAQKAITKVAMNKNKESQDKLFIELNNLEASLNDRIRGLSEKLSGFQEEIERLADHIARINEEAILTVSKNTQENLPVIEKTVVLEDTLNDNFEEEVVLEELKIDEISELEEDNSLFVDPSHDIEESTNELDFGDIDLGGLDLDVDSPIVSDDDILSQLLAAEESPVEEEVDVLAELTKAVEENPTPAPIPADNGGKMNQDDIAALIASMTN